MMKTAMILPICWLLYAGGLMAQTKTANAALTLSEFERQYTLKVTNSKTREEALQQVASLEQQFSPLSDGEAALIWLYRCRAGLVERETLMTSTVATPREQAGSASRQVATYICQGARDDLGLTPNQRLQALFKAYALREQISSPMLLYSMAYRFVLQAIAVGVFSEGFKASSLMLQVSEANDLAGLKLETYRQRAFLHAELGEYDQALQTNQQAIGLADSVATRLGLLTNRGYLLTLAKRYDQAIAVYESVLNEADPASRPQYELWAGSNLSYIYAQTKQIDKNLVFTENLVQVARQNGDPENIAYAFMARAFALHEAGRYDEAQPLFEQYSRWFLDNNFEVRTAEDRESWAKLLFEQGRYAQAYQFLQSSVELYRAIEKKRGNPELDLVNSVLEAEQYQRGLQQAALDLQLAEQKRATQTTLLSVILAAVSLLLLVGGYAYLRLKKLNHSLDRANAQLDYESNHDALTGAYNRRYFQRYCASTSAGQDAASAVILALLDVDHFKKLNDTYGHDVGDEVLKVIVQRLKHATKASDKVVRWGGEEFLLYLPVHGQPELYRQIVARILTEINTRPVQLKDAQLAVTISMGFKLISSPTALEQDLRQVDEYLYSAKRGGRSRAVGRGVSASEQDGAETLFALS